MSEQKQDNEQKMRRSIIYLICRLRQGNGEFRDVDGMILRIFRRIEEVLWICWLMLDLNVFYDRFLVFWIYFGINFIKFCKFNTKILNFLQNILKNSKNINFIKKSKNILKKLKLIVKILLLFLKKFKIIIFSTI